MRQSAFELRYQIYCLERRFLEADDYPDGRESDRHDEESAHFYACNPGRELVGYVRLVPADAGGRFPWQSYCNELISGVKLPRHAQSAEISRLMIRRDYRHRRGDAVAASDGGDDKGIRPGEFRSEPHPVMLDLYRQIYRHSVDADIRYLYAAMEKPLARLLQRLGFGFLQIGPETDYFGPVAPYLIDLRELESWLDATRPELLAWLQKPDLGAS